MFSIGLKNKAGQIVYKNIILAGSDLEASMIAISEAKIQGIDASELTIVRGV